MREKPESSTVSAAPKSNGPRTGRGTFVPVNSAVDFATPHLTQTLHFIGIQDVQVIAADQQLTTADALARAEAQIQALVA